MKQITLQQTGYVIKGLATLNLWGGGQGEIEMNAVTIPCDKLTHKNILRCINDGQFGCESIECAIVQIYDDYNNGAYREYNRSFDIKGMDIRNKKYFHRGI
jgi:hypothetical protein